VCLCSMECGGAAHKGKTIRKIECGAAQKEKNKKMERVCVCGVRSVGQPKGKNNKKKNESGAAQRENYRKLECVCSKQ